MSKQPGNKMSLFLSAMDVWLFRDGRPFDARSHHRAESIFPPHPSVVQGAVRSYELVQRGINLSDRQAIMNAVGTADDPLGLQLRGPWIARCDGQSVQRYFPLPADAWVDERGRARPAAAPRTSPDGVRTNAPAPMLLGLDEPAHKVEEGLWLEEKDLKMYLQYSLNGISVRTIRASDLFLREPRPGVGIQTHQKTAQDGALFEVQFTRPNDNVGLYLEVEGYGGWPAAGVLRLGGEGRGARFFQTQPAAPMDSFLHSETGHHSADPLPERFKILFTTPTCFGGGWLPADPTWAGFFDGMVQLESAAVARYESMGGFDLAKGPSGDHKPARRFVPAGSVYFFSVPAGGTARQKLTLKNRAITDWGAPFGYGQFILQEW